MPYTFTEKHDLFTGFEYTLIDIAGQWGLDKLTFPKRLQWALDNIHGFESLAEERGHWKEHPLFMKGVMALRRMQKGQPTGHMIGLDAICSGMQMLSVISGCETGAKSTGLIDPDRRADAYTDCTDAMRRRIPALPDSGRQDIKDACMTSLYGSHAIPVKIFGDGTPELHAFDESLYEIAPGAVRLLDLFKYSWQKYKLNHAWVLPDNHHADIPVTDMKETRIEIDELGHTKFNYRYEVNIGAKKGISLIANSTHSIDGYVLRALIRRCNYDLDVMANADNVILSELLQRDTVQDAEELTSAPKDLAGALLYRFQQSKVADVSICNVLDPVLAKRMSTEHLHKLRDTLQLMATHEPFPIVCIHDEFKCSPCDMNHLRMHYKEILAELAESTILNDIISQITKRESKIPKLSNSLGEKIRLSNYALC